MGRRRYRRSWSHYSGYVVSKRQELTSTFGGIDRDIERLFLRLPPEDLDDLLEVYGEEFGRSAANYARSTYPKWKSGSVRMSGQVAERLLTLVPPLLAMDVRIELVRRLRAANFRKLHRHVQTTPEGWREALAPVVREVLDHGSTAAIPDAVKSRIAWLADGDTAAAEALLQASDEDDAISRLVYLESEFRRIDELLSQLDKYQRSVSHTIELPQGSIRVNIQPPKVSFWQKLANWWE